MPLRGLPPSHMPDKREDPKTTKWVKTDIMLDSHTGAVTGRKSLFKSWKRICVDTILSHEYGPIPKGNSLGPRKDPKGLTFLHEDKVYTLNLYKFIYYRKAFEDYILGQEYRPQRSARGSGHSAFRFSPCT
eukprot:GHVU01000653.1.p1 GENE.GHVU01000653.1~~GHVU01000653.1.p1  ORF type:complete len:131 (+),score=2.39 GHVU01000653.1:444-836(+)